MAGKDDVPIFLEIVIDKSLGSQRLILIDDISKSKNKKCKA